MSDERRKGVDMRPFAGDEVNAAWAEVNRLRARLAEVEQERDKLWEANQRLAADHYFQRAERAEAALREIASCKSHHPGDCPDIAQKALASVPSSLDAPKRELPCGLCHGYGAANEATHEPVPCLACGKKSEGMIVVALNPPRDELPPNSQHLGLRLVDAPKES